MQEKYIEPPKTTETSEGRATKKRLSFRTTKTEKTSFETMSDQEKIGYFEKAIERYGLHGEKITADIFAEYIFPDIADWPKESEHNREEKNAYFNESINLYLAKSKEGKWNMAAANEQTEELMQKFQDTLKQCSEQAAPQFLEIDQRRNRLKPKNAPTNHPRYFVLLPAAANDLENATNAIRMLLEQTDENGNPMDGAFEFVVYANGTEDTLSDPNIVRNLCERAGISPDSKKTPKKLFEEGILGALRKQLDGIMEEHPEAGITLIETVFKDKKDFPGMGFIRRVAGDILVERAQPFVKNGARPLMLSIDADILGLWSRSQEDSNPQAAKKIPENQILCRMEQTFKKNPRFVIANPHTEWVHAKNEPFLDAVQRITQFARQQIERLCDYRPAFQNGSFQMFRLSDYVNAGRSTHAYSSQLWRTGFDIETATGEDYRLAQSIYNDTRGNFLEKADTQKRYQKIKTTLRNTGAFLNAALKQNKEIKHGKELENLKQYLQSLLGRELQTGGETRENRKELIQYLKGAIIPRVLRSYRSPFRIALIARRQEANLARGLTAASAYCDNFLDKTYERGVQTTHLSETEQKAITEKLRVLHDTKNWISPNPSESPEQHKQWEIFKKQLEQETEGVFLHIFFSVALRWWDIKQKFGFKKNAEMTNEEGMEELVNMLQLVCAVHRKALHQAGIEATIQLPTRVIRAKNKKTGSTYETADQVKIKYQNDAPETSDTGGSRPTTNMLREAIKNHWSEDNNELKQWWMYKFDKNKHTRKRNIAKKMMKSIVFNRIRVEITDTSRLQKGMTQKQSRAVS